MLRRAHSDSTTPSSTSPPRERPAPPPSEPAPPHIAPARPPARMTATQQRSMGRSRVGRGLGPRAVACVQIVLDPYSVIVSCICLLDGSPFVEPAQLSDYEFAVLH